PGARHDDIHPALCRAAQYSRPTPPAPAPRRSEEDPRMRIFSTLVLGLVLAAAAGCASTSKVLLGPARPAIAPAQLQVYFSAPPVREDGFAMLETSGGQCTYGAQNKMDEVIGKLRVAAAELGANGGLFEGSAQGPGGGNVGIGVGGGRFGGSSHL